MNWRNQKSNVNGSPLIKPKQQNKPNKPFNWTVQCKNIENVPNEISSNDGGALIHAHYVLREQLLWLPQTGF